MRYERQLAAIPTHVYWLAGVRAFGRMGSTAYSSAADNLLQFLSCINRPMPGRIRGVMTDSLLSTADFSLLSLHGETRELRCRHQ